MNGYVFYTFEGYTESPTGKECENIQLLGFEYGKNKYDAKKTLVKTRNWIEELDFDVEEIEAKQLLTEENKKDIKAIVEYLWQDEKRHFEKGIGVDMDVDSCGVSQLESICPNHIFCVLKRLNDLIK